MIINNNMSAQYASRIEKFQQVTNDKNMEKLASGMRINRAGDDASGLAVSEKMRSQIRGLNRAGQNIADGISFIQTTEGYLQETQDIVNRIRELAVQSANGIYSNEDRMQIQVEVSQLVDEVNRVASMAEFNGLKMLTGRFAGNPAQATGSQLMQFQVGANMDQSRKISIGAMTASALSLVGEGTKNAISLSSVTLANNAIGVMDKALQMISRQRADLGAYQNRFEMAQKGIAIASENIQAAESRIRDADMATESVQWAKNQILTQSSTAMLAQANQRGQTVLTLLR